MTTSKSARIASWSCQLVAAAVLLQTLFFKFSGAEESRTIFTQLGVEPWGRITSGVVELAASILLLVPATAAVGAVLASGVMGAAILAHVFVLGIEVQGDGGLLFALAVAVLLCSVVVAALRRRELPILGCKLA
jgi:hypothetical protein